MRTLRRTRHIALMRTRHIARSELHHEAHQLIHVGGLLQRQLVTCTSTSALDLMFSIRNRDGIQRAKARQVVARESGLRCQRVRPEKLSRRRRQLHNVLQGLRFVQLLQSLAHCCEGALGTRFRNGKRALRNLRRRGVRRDGLLSVFGSMRPNLFMC